MATNITTYFRNSPPRAGGGLSGSESGLAGIRFICSSVEMGLIPDLIEPVSPLLGEKSNISITACSDVGSRSGNLYRAPHHISPLPRRKERNAGQNATECCFVAALVSVILANAGRSPRNEPIIRAPAFATLNG